MGGLGQGRLKIQARPPKKFQGEAQAGGGVWGEFRHAGANTKRGRTRRPLGQERKPVKKFSFPFRRKNPRAQN